MTREIKFRRYDEWENKMYDIQNMDWCWLSPNHKLWHIHIYWYNSEIETGINIMQYAGLKDKNWKEIFEGDIIEANEYNREGFFRWKIDYNNIKCCFQMCLIWTEYNWWVLHFGDIENIKVIWNIYENPELLNGKQI